MDAAQILSVSVPLSAAYIAQKWFTHLSHRARSAPAAPVVVREVQAPKSDPLSRFAQARLRAPNGQFAPIPRNGDGHDGSP